MTLHLTLNLDQSCYYLSYIDQVHFLHFDIGLNDFQFDIILRCDSRSEDFYEMIVLNFSITSIFLFASCNCVLKFSCNDCCIRRIDTKSLRNVCVFTFNWYNCWCNDLPLMSEEIPLNQMASNKKKSIYFIFRHLCSELTRTLSLS